MLGAILMIPLYMVAVCMLWKYRKLVAAMFVIYIVCLLITDFWKGVELALFNGTIVFAYFWIKRNGFSGLFDLFSKVNFSERDNQNSDKGSYQKTYQSKGNQEKRQHQSNTNQQNRQFYSDNTKTQKKTSRWDSENPYVILGVNSSMPLSEIKREYRKLSKQYHPDISKIANADMIMVKINWAWDRIQAYY